MTLENKTHRALADRSRARILRLLREHREPMDTRELAAHTGLHETTVRAHMRVLAEAGLVNASREKRRSRGRPRVLYQALEGAPVEQDPSGYRLLAAILTAHLVDSGEDAADVAVAAGTSWGAQLTRPRAATDGVTAAQARNEVRALLQRLGFEPEATDDGRLLRLRRCPFLDIAREHPEVTCGVHLGLMRGALEALHAPVVVESLQPFVEPAMCLAFLSDAA